MIYIYYIYIRYIYHIYKVIYIYELCAFCLLQHYRNSYIRWSHWFHIHMIFSSRFLLVETAYAIVNMIQVINKEARAT